MGMREFPRCVPEPYPSVQEVETVNTIIHPKNHALSITMCVCQALLRKCIETNPFLKKHEETVFLRPARPQWFFFGVWYHVYSVHLRLGVGFREVLACFGRRLPSNTFCERGKASFWKSM